VLEAASAATKRYKIGWKSGREVRQAIGKLQSPGLAALFDRHYLDHPVARFDRKYDGTSALADIRLDLALGGFDGIEDDSDTASPTEAPLALPNYTA
jgi:hypothetical protein